MYSPHSCHCGAKDSNLIASNKIAICRIILAMHSYTIVCQTLLSEVSFLGAARRRRSLQCHGSNVPQGSQTVSLPMTVF